MIFGFSLHHSPKLPELSEPTILGNVSEEYLAELGAMLLHRASTSRFRKAQQTERWEVSKGTPKLFAPVMEQILDAMESPGAPIHEVVAIANGSVVMPGETQLASRWHRDRVHSRMVGRVVVANTHPTEVLIAAKGTASDRLAARVDLSLDLRSITRPDGTTVYDTGIPEDSSLEKLGLKVFQPEPGQLIDIQEYIHRSPANNKVKPVSRSFFTALLFKK